MATQKTLVATNEFPKDAKKMCQVWFVLGIVAVVAGFPLAMANMFAVPVYLNDPSTDPLLLVWGWATFMVGFISVIIGGVGVLLGEKIRANRPIAIALSVIGLIFLGAINWTIYSIGVISKGSPQGTIWALIWINFFVILTGHAAWKAPSVSRLDGYGGILVFLGAFLLVTPVSQLSISVSVSSVCFALLGILIGGGMYLAGLDHVTEERC